MSLGVVAAKRGDRHEAEEIASRIARADLPYDLGRKEYYRAWIAAALGDLPQALELLKEAHADGMMVRPERLHASPWLEPLQGYAPFEEWLRPEG